MIRMCKIKKQKRRNQIMFIKRYIQKGCYVIGGLLVLSALTGCNSNAYQPKQTSNIYKQTNKEDKDFTNRNNQDGSDYVAGEAKGEMDIITDKSGDKPSSLPIDIEVGIQLTPTPTIKQVEEEYQCYVIKAPTNESIYVPLVGDFVESYKTDNYTPSNNDTEIGFFWGDSDETILTVATMEKTQTQNFEYFFNYLSGLYNKYLQDPTVTTVELSERGELSYKGDVIYHYTLTHSVRGTDGIVRPHTKSICFLERNRYFVYCILDSSAQNVPVTIEGVIDSMYPIIIENESIDVLQSETPAGEMSEDISGNDESIGANGENTSETQENNGENAGTTSENTQN